MASVRILFLGAGDAFSAAGRHQAGYLISGDGTSILLDCGATTLASLKREGVGAGSLDAIFLSPRHSGGHPEGVEQISPGCEPRGPGG